MKLSLGVEVLFLNISGERRDEVLKVLNKKKLKVKLE